MAIQNVESVLPDKEYIAALEKELHELRSLVERLRSDFTATQRGR